MISKTESGQVSKEISGSGSGSGTRWALAATQRLKNNAAFVMGLIRDKGAHSTGLTLDLLHIVLL